MTPSARARRGVGVEAELVAQHRAGVLAEPGHAVLGALGDLRQLHRVAGDQHRLLDAVGALHLDEHVAAGEVRVGDRPRRAVCTAPAAMPAAVSSFAHRLELRRVRRPRLDARAAARPRGARPQPCARREPRVVEPLGMADDAARALELVLAHELHHEPAVGRRGTCRGSAVLGSLSRCLPERPEVGDDVGHRDGRRRTWRCRRAGPRRCGRGGAARRGCRWPRTAPELMSPSAPTGFGARRLVAGEHVNS